MMRRTRRRWWDRLRPRSGRRRFEENDFHPDELASAHLGSEFREGQPRRGWPKWSEPVAVLLATALLVTLSLVAVSRWVPGRPATGSGPPTAAEAGGGQVPPQPTPPPDAKQVPAQPESPDVPAPSTGYPEPTWPAVPEQPSVPEEPGPGYPQETPSAPDRFGEPEPEPPPPGASFVEIAGAGCPETDSSGSYVAHRPTSAVQTLTGGWSAPGCRGTFWTVPMSGSATEPDSHTYALWWFRTGQVTSGHCVIWMYVPDGERENDVAGEPAHYHVIRARDDTTTVGSFSLDQTVNRGRWVAGGRFVLDSGEIAIKMLNQGEAAASERLGAAQALVECRADR